MGKYLFPRGPANPMWKGGRVIDPRGYVLLRMPGHHLADKRGYVYEHRLKAEQKEQRRLSRGEMVHHKNERKGDNATDNLQPVPSIAAHRFHHRNASSVLRRPGEPNPAIACACGCGTTFAKFDSLGRPRRFISGHNTRIRHGR